jgi:hypothetical protein
MSGKPDEEMSGTGTINEEVLQAVSRNPQEVNVLLAMLEAGKQELMIEEKLREEQKEATRKQVEQERLEERNLGMAALESTGFPSELLPLMEWVQPGIFRANFPRCSPMWFTYQEKLIWRTHERVDIDGWDTYWLVAYVKWESWDSPTIKKFTGLPRALVEARSALREQWKLTRDMAEKNRVWIEDHKPDGRKPVSILSMRWTCAALTVEVLGTPNGQFIAQIFDGSETPLGTTPSRDSLRGAVHAALSYIEENIEQGESHDSQ